MTFVESCRCNRPTQGSETGPSKNNPKPQTQQFYCKGCGGVFTACRKCGVRVWPMDPPHSCGPEAA